MKIFAALGMSMKSFSQPPPTPPRRGVPPSFGGGYTLSDKYFGLKT